MSITHIPFYPSDWLAGTRGMTSEEAGVYITLLAKMYEMAGPIERNDERLYRICGCKSRRVFVKVLEYLISEGKIVEAEGELFNERTAKEIDKVVNLSEKARAAAQARWNKKPNKNNVSTNANASSEHMLNECQSKPELNKEDTEVSLPISTKEAVSEIEAEFESVWVHYPRKTDKKRALAAYRKARKKYSYDHITQPLGKFIRATQAEGDVSNMAYFTSWLNSERFNDEDPESAVTGRTSKGHINGHQRNEGSLDQWAAKASTACIAPPPDGT